VLDLYFYFTKKSNLINSFKYDLIRFFDHLGVAYFFGPPCICDAMNAGACVAKVQQDVDSDESGLSYQQGVQVSDAIRPVARAGSANSVLFLFFISYYFIILFRFRLQLLPSIYCISFVLLYPVYFVESLSFDIVSGQPIGLKQNCILIAVRIKGQIPTFHYLDRACMSRLVFLSKSKTNRTSAVERIFDAVCTACRACLELVECRHV